jgi:hypothetical protein
MTPPTTAFLSRSTTETLSSALPTSNPNLFHINDLESLKKYFLIQRLQQAKNKANQGPTSSTTASVTTSVPTTVLSHAFNSTVTMSPTSLPTAGLTSAAVTSSAAAFAASQTSTILTTASTEVHLTSVVLETASSTEPSVSVTNTNSPSPAIVTGVLTPAVKTAASPLPIPTLNKTSGFTSVDPPTAFHSTSANFSASADAPPASELASSQTALPLVEVDGALLLVEPENNTDQSSSLEGTSLTTPEPSLAKLLAHEEQLQNYF